MFDILCEEQGRCQSRLGLERALQDQVVAKFTLAGATVRLTPRNLGLDVMYYDPVDNFLCVKGANGLSYEMRVAAIVPGKVPVCRVA